MEFTTRTSGSRSSFSQGIIYMCVCARVRTCVCVCINMYMYIYIESLAEFGSASVESTFFFFSVEAIFSNVSNWQRIFRKELSLQNAI